MVMRTKTSYSSLKWLKPWMTHSILLVLGFFYLFPFIWMVGSSLKTPGEFFSSGLNSIPAVPQWQNYAEAWNQAKFGRYLINTVIVTFGSTALVVVLSAMSGYVLSRYTFPGRMAIIFVITALYFLPDGYAIVPLFDMISQLGLLNNYIGIILPTASGALIYFTILFAGYFSTLAHEIEESAVMDGASLPVLFWYIAFPQARPMAATAFLFNFMSSWNAFFLPLVLTIGNPDLRTLAVGMTAYVSENSTRWTWVCAGAVISILPVMVVFVFLQRYFVDAIAGAVKG
jgi:ABC-type glycerol-3-phosphate transport system permease component